MGPTLYGREEFRRWLDAMSMRILGIGAEEFAERFRRGEYRGSAVASALGGVIPFAGLDMSN